METTSIMTAITIIVGFVCTAWTIVNLWGNR